MTVAVSTRSALGCMAFGISASVRAGRPANASMSSVVAPLEASQAVNFARYSSAPGSCHRGAATSSSYPSQATIAGESCTNGRPCDSAIARAG